MPRLFLGNYDFEYHLADPRFTSSKKLLEINLRFASAWFAMAEQGDYIWLPNVDAPLPKPLMELAELVGVHLVREENLPHGPDVEFVPWGWLSSLEEVATHHKWTCEIPTNDSVQFANSRTLSSVVDEFSFQVETLSDFNDALAEVFSTESRVGQWIAKPEFSMSGRECLRSEGGTLSDSEQKWVRDRLEKSPLFVEPWLEGIEEISLHWEIPDVGTATFCGFTELKSDSRGQYAGSRVGSPAWFESHNQNWGDVIQACEHAMDATTMLTRVYFGPVGIDAMEYRDAVGEVRIRPFQDINARWTMGRLAVEYARRFPPKEPILWTPENPLPHRKR